MAYETIEFTVADGVAHLRLNRPDALNTLVMAFWQEMVDIFAEIEGRGDIRAVVISSTGRHFTAGPAPLPSSAGLPRSPLRRACGNPGHGEPRPARAPLGADRRLYTHRSNHTCRDHVP